MKSIKKNKSTIIKKVKNKKIKIKNENNVNNIKSNKTAICLLAFQPSEELIKLYDDFEVAGICLKLL